MSNVGPSTTNIALVLDGEVVHVMRTDDRLAAILLSNPEAADVTDLTPDVVLNKDFDVMTRTWKKSVSPDNA